MSALGTLALVLPLLGSHTRTDVATGLQSTTRAGLIPQDVEQPGEPGADSALTLFAGGRVLSARTSFLLVYAPRLYVQLPGTIDLGRPLVMQQLGAYYRSNLTRRTNLAFDLVGTAGEVSYTYFNQDLAPGTSTVDTSTLPMFTIAGSTQLDHQTSRRNSVSATVDAGYQSQPEFLFGDTTDRAFPTALNTSLTLADVYALTARDTVGISLRTSYINTEPPEAQELLEIDTPGEVVTFGGGLSWRRTLSLRSELSLEGGAEVAYALDTEETSLIPTAVATHTTTWRGDNQQWRQSVGGGVRGFFDQVSATYRPQGFATYGLMGAFGRRWTSGFNLFGFTSLASQPLEPQQFETTVTVEQPTTYRFSPGASLGFGGRASARGSHLLEEDNVPVQWEAVGFVDFRYTFGTGPSQGAWLR